MVPTTFDDLKHIVNHVRPAGKERQLQSDGADNPIVANQLTKENIIQKLKEHEKLMLPDMDEVYPNIFIGNIKAAQDLEFQRKSGITHVLNMAFGETGFGTFVLNEKDLKGIKVHQVKGLSDFEDVGDDSVLPKFKEGAAFIQEAIEAQGKVLVCCYAGMSRSSTAVLTYLIVMQGLPASEALTALKTNRDVQPSHAYLVQMAKLSNEQQGIPSKSVSFDHVKKEVFRERLS